MESILFAATPVIAYGIAGGKRKPLNLIVFLAIMFGVTIGIMYYRCKIATSADEKGNKPNVDIKKAYIPMIPLIIWALVAFSLPYLARYGAPPPLLLILLFATKMIGLFIVGFTLYLSSLRFGAVPQCYPSTLDQIFGILKWLWPF